MPPTHPNRHILARIPLWISHWLGYRPHHPPAEPPYAIYLWSFIGAFCGLSALQAIFGQISYFIDQGVPPILASYVCYSPLALLHLFSHLVFVVLLQEYSSGNQEVGGRKGADGGKYLILIDVNCREHPPSSATPPSKHPSPNPVPSWSVTSSPPSPPSVS